MKKVRAFGKKNQKGATLVMVVGIFSVLIIIVTATVSVATAARRQTYTKYCSSQAYYYANSALNVFVSNTAVDDSLKEFLTNVSSSKESEEIEIGNNSTVKYYITKQTDGKLLVKVEGTFDGRKAYSSVLLNSDGTTQTPIFSAASVTLDGVKFSNSFFATGDIISKFPSSGGTYQSTNYSKTFGNIYSTGDIEFNSDSSLIESSNPDVFSIQTPKEFSVKNPTVRMSYPSTVRKAFINCNKLYVPVNATVGSSSKYLDIHCTHVELNSIAKIYGNLNLYKVKDSAGRVISSPSINIGGSTIYGDVYIDGDIEIGSYGDATIKGNLIVAGSCKLNQIKVEGNVYCWSYSGGYGTNVQGEVHSIVGGDTWDESHDRPLLASKPKPPIDDPDKIFKPYEIDSEAYVSANSVNFNQQIYNANRDGLVINNTGTLNGNTISGKTITINVRDQVIWLKLNVSKFDGCKIVIKKDSEYPETPVYFYLPTGKTIQVNQTSILTDETADKLNHNVVFQVGKDENDVVPITKGQPVYWLLGSNSEIISWNSTTEAYIYGPKAKVTCNDSGYLTASYSINGVTRYSGKPQVIGAIVCHSVNMDNEAGILYLIPLKDGMHGINNPPVVDDEPENWTIDTYIRQ